MQPVGGTPADRPAMRDRPRRPSLRQQSSSDRERPLLHALHPVPRGLAVAPAREIGLERRFGRLAKGGNPCSPLLRQRVSAIGNLQSILDGAFAGVRERDQRVGAETDVVAASIDHDPLNPRLGSGRRDVEIKRVAIAVSTRNQSPSNGRSRQFCHVHTHIHTHTMCEIRRGAATLGKTIFLVF